MTGNDPERLLTSHGNLQLFTYDFVSVSSLLLRAEEVAVRHLLTVRSDPGHPGLPDAENEGAGLCDLQRG